MTGTHVELISVEELPGPDKDKKLGGKWALLHAADAIVSGCPTSMGTVSAGFKTFMEHTSGPWFGQAWKDKLAGGFTNSGGPSGDELTTMLALVVLAGQHSMNWISQGIVPSALTGGGKDLNRASAWLGPMATSGNESPEVTPPAGDRLTAELYGERVAKAAARWTK